MRISPGLFIDSGQYLLLFSGFLDEERKVLIFALIVDFYIVICNNYKCWKNS